MVFVIQENEIEHFALRRCRRKYFMFEQQEFEYYMRPSNALRRYNGCRTLALLGVYLVCIGLIVKQLSGGALAHLPYDQSEKEFLFRLREDLSGPIGVYVYLDNFYSNVRQYLDDSPRQLSFKGSCERVNTIGELNSLRSPESFPEVNHSNKSEIFEPCGLQSATFFNDHFSIQGVECVNTCHQKISTIVERVDPECCEKVESGKSIKILDDAIAMPDYYPLFAKPPVAAQWTNLITDYRAQSWYSKPFLNKRMVFIGLLSTYRLSTGYYKLTFSQNVWPAREWNTHKEVILANFGALGSKQEALFLLCAIWGLTLIGISLVFYWAVRRDIVFLTDTMAEIPADEIQNQWIQHAKGWKATS